MKGCRPFSDAEIMAVISRMERGRHPARDRALFLLGIRSGFRISELLSLTVGDVFQNGNFVSQISVAKKNMKKKTEGRIIPLHEEAKAAIKELVGNPTQTATKTYLFLSQKGLNQPLSRKTAWHMLRKACARCGLTGKLGTHSMRKTFAKRVYERLDKDLIKTQKAMGHKSVTSTAAYLSFSDDEIDDAILKS